MGARHGATTKCLLSCLDAFDTWALCKILKILCTCHVSNAEVRGTTGFHRFLTWQLTDICGSSAILLAVHLARIIPSLCSGYPTSTTRLEAAKRKTWLCGTEADLSELRPRLEENHYSRWMVTHNGHSSAPVEYAVKERRKHGNCRTCNLPLTPKLALK